MACLLSVLSNIVWKVLPTGEFQGDDVDGRDWRCDAASSL